MNMMITEVYDALIDAGAQELKARDAARVLADLDLESRDQFSALREDNQAMRTEMAELNGSLREDMQRLRADMTGEMASLRDELKGEMASLDANMNGRIAGLQSDLTAIKWMFGALAVAAIGVAIRVLVA